MPGLTKDQLRHEVINLSKTLSLLDKSVKMEDWERCTSKDRLDKFLKAQTILSGIKHCRAVLARMTPEEYDLSLGNSLSVTGQQFHNQAHERLDTIESEMKEAVEDLRPRAKHSTPILPTLPKPKHIPHKHPLESDDQPAHSVSVDETLIPISASEMRDQPELPPAYADELILASDEGIEPTSWDVKAPLRLGNPSTALLPPSLPSTSTTSTKLPDFLKTSTATHDELSHQLAQMATQLRRNAETFNASLQKDSDVLKETQEKLEGNYGLLSQERVRLRDHTGKSSGTTWIVFLSLLVVAVGFMMTFFVIRIS